MSLDPLLTFFDLSTCSMADYGFHQYGESGYEMNYYMKPMIEVLTHGSHRKILL